MECNHPNDGSLLIQYILNLLNDEDRCRFEEHLMNCESCRSDLSKADPEFAAIGAYKERIVEALHKEGISFERLRRELISAKRKKGIFQEFLGELSETVDWLFRTKRLALVVGAVAIVLLTVLLLKDLHQDNPYLPMLSFEKFVYQELSTRDQAPTISVNPLFSKGMKAYNENDYENAAKIFMDATQLSPHEWSVWFFLGLSYYLDKQAKIKWYLAQAYLLNNDPNSASPYLLWLKEKPGDYSSKADILFKAIQEVKDTSD